MHRRNIPIRLDANTNDPEARKFKYDFDLFLKRTAGASSGHASCASSGGCSRASKNGVVELASFEKWSRVLGGILDAAGIDGFLMNMRDYKEHGLEARTHDTGLVEALIRTFGFNRFTAAEAIDRLMINPDTSGALEPMEPPF